MKQTGDVKIMKLGEQMYNQLLNAKKEGKIVSLYTDKETTDKFTLGFVLKVSLENVLIASISTFGLNDGFVLLKLQDIYRMDCDGKYEMKIFRLYNLNNQRILEIEENHEDMIVNMFGFAKLNRLVVSIELCDSGYDDVQGYVDDICEETVTLRQITNYAEPNGNAIIKINEISAITCDSDKEKALKILSE